MSLTSIAVFIIALAFAITCFYICTIILQITGLLKTITSSTRLIEKQLDQTIIETGFLIEQVEMTAKDVYVKLHETDSVFKSVDHIGEATSNITSAIQQQTALFQHETTVKSAQPFIKSIQWTEYAFGILNSWKRGKNAAFESRMEGK